MRQLRKIQIKHENLRMVFLSVPNAPNCIYPQSFPLPSFSRILPMKVLRFPNSLRKTRFLRKIYIGHQCGAGKRWWWQIWRQSTLGVYVMDVPPPLRQARIGHVDGRTGGANFLSRGVLMAGKSWWRRGFPGKMPSLLRHCQPRPVISTFIRK